MKIKGSSPLLPGPCHFPQEHLLCGQASPDMLVFWNSLYFQPKPPLLDGGKALGLQPHPPQGQTWNKYITASRNTCCAEHGRSHLPGVFAEALSPTCLLGTQR